MVSDNRTTSWWQGPLALIIAGGIIMGLALGVRHAQGIFQLPVTADKGWPRETFAFALAMQNLVWGVTQPFTGMIADRFGAARVIFVGLLCYAAGLFLMAHATLPFQFLLADGLLIGLALSGTAFGAVYGALSRMIEPARRSAALGLAGAIGGLGQFVLVPVAQTLLDGMGWAAAIVALGFACAILTPASVFFARRENALSSERPRQSMTSALREAFAQRSFWLLTTGFLACGFQLAFIASHLPAYLLDKGLTGRHAMTGLAIIALTNIAGTYACGLLGGKYSRKNLLALLYLLRSLSMALFVLLPLSPTSTYVFCAAMGFMWLGTLPLTNGILSNVFGVQYITTLFGFVFLGHQVGSFFGVWLGGLLFDMTGSYTLVWMIGISLGVIAAALHYPITDRALPAGATGGALA